MTWRERVALATARGRFTREDRQLVGSWDTCAVGEQRAQFPEVVLRFYGSAMPADPMLHNLGDGAPGGFAFAVEGNMPEIADAILDEIEDRVLQLKREQGT